jgi:tetratricopeptide (TPR) repeat protein
MTVPQARKEFYRLFGQAAVLSGNPRSEFWAKKLAVVQSVTLRGNGLEFTYVTGRKSEVQTTSCTFDSLSDPEVRDHGGFVRGMRYAVNTGLACDWGMAFGDADDAIQFAKALCVLKHHAIPPEDPAASAAFDAAAKSYLAANPKPELPEEARKFKVQAELALDQGRDDEALEKYGQALQIAPWWPDGHYNRGIIFGRLEFYPEAIREMQRYLRLVPDATDARAVQDKIYQWESQSQAATAVPAPQEPAAQQRPLFLWKAKKK